MNYVYIISFFLILLPRLLIIFLFPETGGDYEIYNTVAKNIIKGCGVSLSNPSGNYCLPHFGGNHGPGYPFFISIIWYLFGEQDYLVRVYQALIYAICCLYLLYSMKNILKKPKILFTFGLLLSFSPLLLAWPRYLQTETLSIAFSIYLLAEIIFSLRDKKIRIIPISLALILATWIRLDNIFLCIPIIFLSFYLHNFKIALMRGFVIAAILFSTWGAWTVRNIMVELPNLFPTDMVMPDGSRSPTGYFKWTKTWITHEYERPGALWGVNRKNYIDIRIPENAFNNIREKNIVTNLLRDLKRFDKKPFPKYIDDEFKKLAINKISDYPLDFWIIKPVIRSIRIWSNPFSSFGWPNQMKDQEITKSDRLAAAKGNIKILLQKANKYPFHALSKGFNALYRLILITLYLYSLVILFRSKNNNFIFPLGIISLLYIISRTLFFSFSSNFETRYMVTTIPYMEIFVFLSLHYRKSKS